MAMSSSLAFSLRLRAVLLADWLRRRFGLAGS
jgi:hypothetical protein